MSGERGTIGLIHGSGHRAVHWDPLRPELERRGYATVAVDLPSTEPGATYEDFAAVAANTFRPFTEGGRKIDIVAHSGGSHVVPGLIKRLGESSIRGITHISGSLGASSETNGGTRDAISPWRPAVIPRPRSTVEFQGAILPVVGREDWVAFNPAQIYNLFFGDDCRPEVFMWALANMQQPYVRPKNEPPLEAHYQPNIPQRYVRLSKDRIRDPAWVDEAVGSLGMTIVDMEGGHSPAITRPQETAVVLDLLLQQTNNEPVTADLQLPATFGRPQP